MLNNVINNYSFMELRGRGLVFDFKPNRSWKLLYRYYMEGWLWLWRKSRSSNCVLDPGSNYDPSNIKSQKVSFSDYWDHAQTDCTESPVKSDRNHFINSDFAPKYGLENFSLHAGYTSTANAQSYTTL